MKIPINICLFTSTKGHFGCRDRVFQTLDHLNYQLPLSSFAGLFAHIKISPGEEDIGLQMSKKIEGLGFTVLSTVAPWAHQNQSHQTQYILDIYKMFSDFNVNKTEYSLFMEDDFLLVPRKEDLIYYFAKATKILKENPDVVSVRIPRCQNEKNRILNLRQKHGIDSHVEDVPGECYFLGSDYGNNPHVCRTRDMRNSMIMINKIPQIPVHSEHGTAIGLKFFSHSKTPVAVFLPSEIVARHIGVEPNKGLEEPLDQDIILP